MIASDSQIRQNIVAFSIIDIEQILQFYTRICVNMINKFPTV